MKKNGFNNCTSDYCIYLKTINDLKLFVILYVDDLVVLSKSGQIIEQFIQSLKEKYEIVIMEKFDHFLGINIDYDEQNHCIKLKQTKFINEILIKFGMSECKKVITPMDPNTKLIKQIEQKENEFKNIYQQIIGSLHYLVTCTRPDLAIVTCVLSQFSSNPSLEHYKSAKHVLRYLIGTKNYGIIIKNEKSSDSFNLNCYVDADWGSNFEDKRSTTGYLFYLNDDLISWSTRKQQTVALSSTEAEYMAESEAVKEVIWLKTFINELLFEIKIPIQVNCDNQAAIKLAKNPIYHARTKHIDIRHHFIREKVNDGLINLNYIQTSENIADIMTKPLSGPKFNDF